MRKLLLETRTAAGRRAGLCILAALVLGFGLSCELSPSLLSDSERSSLYTLSLNAEGRSIGDGAVVDAGSAITASVAKMTDAQEPGQLDLSLERGDGTAVAGLRLSSAAPTIAAPAAQTAAPAAAAAGSMVQQVPRISGSLPALQLPGQLSPGAYRLVVTISSPEGKQLQRSSTVVFVGTGSPSLDSVLAYPPAVEPGASILLAAVVTDARAPSGADPWIRWSRSGTVFAQGPLSAGLDRVVWTAPRVEGAYALSVDVYPAAPPDSSGFSFRAPAHQDLKAMVRMPPGGSTDEFADSLSFSSLLRFSGSFEDTGTRLRSSEPVAIGQPQLDVYSGGFGYRFGAAAGLRLPGLTLPSEAGRMLPVVVMIRLAPDGDEGRLVRFASEDLSFYLDLGLHEGRPYLEVLSGGQTQRSSASQSLGGGAKTVAAILSPQNGRLEVAWYDEGRRLEVPPLSLPSLPPSGSALIGGAGSLPGVYDDFGLMSRAFPPPLYRFAQRRQWRGDLVMAEGFEDGQLPDGWSKNGASSLSPGRLELGPGAAALQSGSIRVDRPLLAELAFSGPPSSIFLDLIGAKGRRLASIDGAGTILGEGTSKIGSLNMAAGELSLRIDLGANGLTLRAGSGGSSYLVPTASNAGGPEQSLSLELRTDEGGAKVVVQHVLVRSALAKSAP